MFSYIRINFVFRSQGGFTLVEVIITLTILVIILGATAPITWSFFQRVELASEVRSHTAYLKLARAYALANRHQSAHGVYIGSSYATVFQGASYAARDIPKDRTFPRSRLVSATTTLPEIVFSPLSATSTAATTTLWNAYGSTTIIINSEGTIE